MEPNAWHGKSGLFSALRLSGPCQCPPATQPKYRWGSRSWRFTPKAISMSRSARTGNGRLLDPTDAAGSRAEWKPAGVRIATVTGNKPTLVGTGPAMSRGAGPLTIMAAGIRTHNLAGIGCRRRNGHSRGSPGEKAADTSAGAHWVHRGGASWRATWEAVRRGGAALWRAAGFLNLVDSRWWS